MFLLCYRDAYFRARLERRYDEVRTSGQLSEARLREQTEALAERLDPVMAHQIATYGAPSSVGEWYVEMEDFVGDYALRYSRLPKDFE